MRFGVNLMCVVFSIGHHLSEGWAFSCRDRGTDIRHFVPRRTNRQLAVLITEGANLLGDSM